jgi:hypothetical protein
VGTRKDHIMGHDRAQIAMEMLASYRPYGMVTQLAHHYQMSRQAIYRITAKAKVFLDQAMTPGGHGAQVCPQQVRIDRERVARSTLVLTHFGVSQRDLPICLEELLDTQVSPSWVNAQLAPLEQAAARINQGWQPQATETLSGDEIYSNGRPNLLVVGNDSLYIYALTRQDGCDGDTWGCVLLDSPHPDQFSSDGGLGLAAGAQAAGIVLHQLDWDHLLRPLWGQVARLERQAYAALAAVETHATQFMQAHTAKRLDHHLAEWERLRAIAEAKLVQCDQFTTLAQQVDDQFGLIDLSSGHVRDGVAAAHVLATVGQQMHAWSGRIYTKLSANLIDWGQDLFAYQSVLEQALAPLYAQWGAPAIQALASLWQLEADAKRQPLPLSQRPAHQAAWNDCLDRAVAQVGLESLMDVWQALSQVLNRSWRGSMLCECVNSLLRPVLAGRKSSDQGCLELFRFLHNVHRFPRGKRAGHSPAELVGIEVPADPLTLLGLAPKCQSNSLAF